MSFRASVGLAAVWLTSLLVVGMLAKGQAFQSNPLPEPVIISGSDIGFRVEGRLGNAPTGRWIIRMDGKWVEPQVAPTVRPVR